MDHLKSVIQLIQYGAVVCCLQGGSNQCFFHFEKFSFYDFKSEKLPNQKVKQMWDFECYLVTFNVWKLKKSFFNS